MLQVCLFVVCCERSGQGPGIPGIPRTSLEGGCVRRKEESPRLGVFGQGKSFLLLPDQSSSWGGLGSTKDALVHRGQGCSTTAAASPLDSS